MGLKFKGKQINNDLQRGRKHGNYIQIHVAIRYMICSFSDSLNSRKVLEGEFLLVVDVHSDQ